jgi:hypothetical protein
LRAGNGDDLLTHTDKESTLTMISTNYTGVRIVLLVVALSLTGCGKLGEDKTSNMNAPASPASSPAAEGGRAGSVPTGTDAATVSAGAVLATSDGDKPGIRVEVLELKRTSGNTVNLKFAMINDSDKDLAFSYNYGEGGRTGDFNSVAGAHLIDAEGQKKYFVVRDTEGACLCSRGLSDIKPKTRANLWAKFPAPPDEVQKITVVIPHFTPMDDVPLNR